GGQARPGRLSLLRVIATPDIARSQQCIELDDLCAHDAVSRVAEVSCRGMVGTRIVSNTTNDSSQPATSRRLRRVRDSRAA
ncbi:hypothetical protein, partial [Klebsiella pneumoniae]|uniref:hypothetical protein n=1 Tax=Klebsiella pneumoniae TaxID=573 RepID=UPI00272F3B88